MKAFAKLKLLVWKNCLLQRRHKWQTLFEILSPVVFALLLILTRCLVDPETKPERFYPPFKPTYFNISGQAPGNVTMKSDKVLAFSPDNILTRKVTMDAMERLALDNIDGFLALFFNPALLPEPKAFPNAKAMEKELSKPNAMKDVLVGIQFSDSMANATEWPDNIEIALRFPAVMRATMAEHPLKASWRTNLLFPVFPKPGPREPDDMYGGKTPGYSGEMFLAIQHAVSMKIIEQKSGKSINTNVYMQRLPQLSYRDDKLLMALERFVSMIIMLCFAYPFVNTVRAVTTEKELQLKETMTIMGLPYWLHWVAWFIKQFSFLFISVVILTILFKIPFNETQDGVKYAVMTFTPWSVIMFFMSLFVIASIAFSFMISVFFTKANTASSFMGLAWFASYSLFMMTQVLYEDISMTTKALCSLISTSAMGYAFQMMIIAEGSSQGLQWGDFFKSQSYSDPYQPGHVMIMLIVDTVIYMMIAMYVEKIRPGAYGVPLPWYFPFMKSYWFPEKKVAEVTTKNGIDHEYNNALLKVIHDEEPNGVPMGVNIQNLTKVYGKKKAVDNLNLRMYENEITVLLGHNGAGKTTTISMLTGTVPPSSGTAYISGYDIVTETEQARKSLGICPQHNVLFPDLTVAEHIIFYSRLKGVPSEKLQQEVDHFVKLLELVEKKDVESRHLSGGQKRRLSVGAAMCGSSRVVLLDEPTSGLDPAARRGLWDLLLKEKKGRTMILSTHFMDEADVLGDRIAIMSGGHLQCHGTPYFLKKHYGVGYKFTIVKGDNCTVSDITTFIKSYVPETKENTNIGSELTYILPNEAVSKFPEMLKEFEERKHAFNVSSYGLSVTSLEEVFMKAGAEEEETDTHSHTQINSQAVMYKDCAVVPIMERNHITVDNDPIQKVKGFRLLKNHIKAMFLKHAYNSVRNKMTALVQFISPIINIILSVIVSRSWQFMSELPALNLSLTSGFKMTQTLISEYGNLTDADNVNSVKNSYKDYFKTTKYPGMTITDINTMDLGKFYLKLSAMNTEKTRFETLVGATFTPKNITAWFSNNGLHDSAISLAMVDDAILRTVSPNSTLTVINRPLPYSIETLVRVMAAGGMGFQFAFNIAFTLAFVTSFIVLFTVKERASGAKLLQRVSGLKPIVMWVCAFIWDWIWLLLIYIIIVITLAIFQEKTLSTPAELSRIIFVLMVFSVAIIPLHYLASFYFENPAAGFSKMCFINMFCGSMPFLVTEVLSTEEFGNPFYANLFDWLFSPLPIYCVSRSLRDMSMTSFRFMACEAMCDQYKESFDKNCTLQTVCKDLNISLCCMEKSMFMDWSEPGVGRYIFMMLLVGAISFAILMIKEYELLNELLYKNITMPLPPLVLNEDSDVASERRTVTNFSKSELQQQSLVCKDLTKYYKKFLAVNRLTFAVRKAECFGLLGINGAGKTSTFRMLTGDSRISAGDAFVLGLPIKTRLQDVHKHIGYCPQFDALLDNLTARETLDIFCLLRGIPERVGAARANQLALALGFRKHFDKKVNACSGGTKRKISTAVALLGDSPLIYLDEPTTGMDPASKRLVWSAISQAVMDGRSIVLTSHSMEECEALCSRLTVMVNGQLYGLGPLQHLKTKFSQGYTLIVKCRPDCKDDQIDRVKKYVLEHFVDSRHTETYLGIVTFYLNDQGLPWWRVFHIMEEARVELSIEDYSVTQTTLEQVFLRFTRLHGNKDL